MARALAAAALAAGRWRRLRQGRVMLRRGAALIWTWCGPEGALSGRAGAPRQAAGWMATRWAMRRGGASRWNVVRRSESRGSDGGDAMPQTRLGILHAALRGRGAAQQAAAAPAAGHPPLSWQHGAAVHYMARCEDEMKQSAGCYVTRLL